MDYRSAFSDLGIDPNGCVYVAASSISMLWNPNFVKDINDSLTDYFINGTIVMPAFSSDFRNKGVFNAKDSKSICGLIAEYFRRNQNVSRTTLSPLHTVCCKGTYEREIMQCKAKTSFGNTSVFEFLKNINATVLLIDCSFFDGVPFINALEEQYQVPYRYWQSLSGEIINGSSREDLTIAWYAKCIDQIPDGHIAFPGDLRYKCLTELGKVFYESGSVKTLTFNKTKFAAFELQDFYGHFEPKLLADKTAFICDTKITG